MAFLTSLHQMRNIEFGKSYLWDIRFPDVPAPFNEWFPATEVEDDVASIESFEVEAFDTTIKVPQKTSSKSLRITFVDDVNLTLLKFFKSWMKNEILNENQTTRYTSTLEESVKRIIIQKLDAAKNPVSEITYWVYPEEQLTFSGDSESGSRIYTMSFVKAGTASDDEL